MVYNSAVDDVSGWLVFGHQLRIRRTAPVRVLDAPTGHTEPNAVITSRWAWEEG
jgi:hypothetical protein